MDDSSRDAPIKKPLPTIRHLLDTSIDEIEKKKQPRRLIRRSGPFKWRRGRRKSTTTEEKTLKIMSADHFMESESSAEEDFDEFSDAMSHTHTEACSLSMVSEINSVDDDDGSIHAETRSFIMDRFLPAAKAMAASESSAQRARSLTPLAKEKRAGMFRIGSRSAGPLPRQSIPYVLAKRNSVLPETDEEDDRLPFKMACGSFFAWHFKNVLAHVIHPPLSARKKSNDRRGLYEDEEDEDSSSGTDIIDERAIIAAARKKAWEARHRKSSNGLANSSPTPESNDLRDSSSPLMDRVSYNSNSRSQSPLTKPDRALSSPYRSNRSRSPDLTQQGKGFLGFPSDRHLNNSKIKAEDAGVHNPAASTSNVNSFTDSNEVEHEDWYSGNSSPSPQISENSDSVTIEKGFHHDQNTIAEENGGPPVVSVLPPPLPKSPTESWLWRAMPLVTASNSMNSPLSRGLGKAIKTHPDEFDAKWETV